MKDRFQSIIDDTLATLTQIGYYRVSLPGRELATFMDHKDGKTVFEMSWIER